MLQALLQCVVCVAVCLSCNVMCCSVMCVAVNCVLQCDVGFSECVAVSVLCVAVRCRFQ